jgi:hypothetical protein
MAGSRAPQDVRLLEWARDDFGRVRAEWLQLHRWDTNISPATVTALAEIAGRMAHDKDFAWPSIQRLAADLGWSEPTVKRAIAQAIERGWLVCEKRGFGGSNHYAMSASPSVTSEVLDRHDERVALLIEGRPASLRSQMISMEIESNEINSDPSMRSKMIPHSDQKRSLNEINFDPLTLSKNLTSEPDHRSSSERLGDRVEDRSPDETILPSLSPFLSTAVTNPSTGLVDDDDPDLSPREVLFSELGDGDVRQGRLIADALGPQRCAFLQQQIVDVGSWRARLQIKEAAAQARARLAPSHSQPGVQP